MTSPHRSILSRRGFCLCCLTASTVAAAGGWLSPRSALADGGIVELILADAAKSPITIHRLRNNVSVLEGSGGNIAVLTGRDGKLLVDCGIAVSRPQIETALATLSDDPITHLINTHWHFDHASGNEWVHSMGATILAHENTRKHLLTAQRVEDWDYNFLAPPASALPTDLFTTERTMELNRTKIALRYYGPAHTDSDISVSFPDADILHCADTFWNGIYPMIDYSTGGNIDGMINAANANVDATTDKTIVIPGHGHPIANRAQLIEYRDMLVAIRGNVAMLKKQGKPLEEIVAAQPTAAFDAKWGQFVIGPHLFTRLVHAGV
jgi:glyoxylase-like metal-dependent hydrolase (beta-lactamase superfamily II)